MDQADCDLDQLYRTLDQFTGINVLFSRVRGLLKQTVLKDMEPGRTYHLIDLGAGACDIPIWLLKEAKKRGLDLKITAVDADPRIVAYAQQKHQGVQGLTILEADALHLDALGPFDYLFANHFLHHLPTEVLPTLIQEAHRLSQRGFVFSDLKRSEVSYIGFSIFARVYRNSFAREDGLISIKKGFLPSELREISAEVPVKVKTAIPGRVQLFGGCFAAE